MIELVRDKADTIIMSILQEQDNYCYEILDILKNRSGGKYGIKQPTLYNALKRLEKQGFVESYHGDETKGGMRVYYRLTDKGKTTLNQDKQQYEFSRTILDTFISDKSVDLQTADAPFSREEFKPATKRVRIPSELNPQKTENENAPLVIQISTGEARKPQDISGAVRTLVFTEEKPFSFNPNVFDNSQKPEEKKTQDEKPFSFNPNIERSAEEKPLSFNPNPEKISEDKPLSFNPNIYEERLAKSYVREEKDAQNILFQRQEVKLTPPTVVVSDAPTISKDSRIHKPTMQQLEAQKLLQIGMFADDPAKYYNLNEEKAQPEFTQTTNLSKYDGFMSNSESLLFGPLAEKAQNEITSARLQGEAPANRPNPFAQQSSEPHGGYKDTLGALFRTALADDLANVQTENKEDIGAQFSRSDAKQFSELKENLRAEGIKIKTYSKANSQSHYYMNNIYTRKLFRDTALLSYLVIALLLTVVFVARSAFGYSPSLILNMGLGALALPVLATAFWAIKPFQKKRANFSMNTAMFFAVTLYILISGITTIIYLAVPSYGVTFASGKMYAPFVLALFAPASVLIYNILYRTRNYHTKN
ncbi:MAG: PadR family transcriptional regulator [Firmicutes bacterium]|nr:PadR family transcriptional regulator [Bacillota bacterium]